MNDIEGKAVREAATEQGREGVSIMMYEMKTALASASEPARECFRSR